MHFKYKNLRIGLRTLKTAVAVILSMMIVTSYGATTSRLIFAMLGAMAAMEPSFKESLESCLTQIVGMFFGVLAGVILLNLPLNSVLVAGIGIVFVITQTSHTKNGIRTLKNQYFSSQISILMLA